MPIDIGDTPTGTPPTTGEKLQIRTAIGLGQTDAPTFLAASLTNNASVASGKIIIGLDGTNDYTIQAFQGATRVGRIGFNEIGNNIVIAPFANTVTLFTGGIGIGAISPNNDCFIQRDAAGILAQRNGTAAQTFRVYNTYTDASNYDRLSFFHSSGMATIMAEGAGTGLAGSHLALRASGATKAIIFYTGALDRWAINSAGNFTAQNDNAYDIGASGANRPKNIYVGTSIFTGVGGINFDVNARIRSPADSIVTLYNSALTDFGRLQLGGTTSAFPAIKRNATGIDIRLADDSAFAPLNCGNLAANGNIRSTDTALIGWLNTRSAMISPADGVIRLTNNAGTSYTRLELGEANLGISRGTGSPEGVVTALVGSLYLRTDGGLLTTLYVKESGTGNTGWAAK
jgi:hypothetical protein